MSIQQKNTLKNLIKKGMFASTAAMMLASTSSLGAALVNRNVTNNGAVLSSGVNLDQNGAVNVPFNPASVLTFDDAYSATADVPVIAGMYIAKAGTQPSVTFSQNITLGCIVPPALNLAATSLNMSIPTGVTVTLNGVAPSQAAASGAINAAGGANPFAPGLGNNVPADTYFINNIDFPNAGGVLEINAGGAIQLNAATNNTTITNGANGTVNVNSELNVKDQSWTTLKAINIANGILYSYINNDVGPVDVNPFGNLVFKGATSRADFSNESGLSGEFLATVPITSAVDATGIVAFHVSTSATDITAAVGTNNAQRLNTFITDGLNVTTIKSNIFAQNIEISQNSNNVPPGTTQLIWTTPVDTGANGLIYFITPPGEVVISEFQQNITSDIDFKGTSVVNILDDGVTVTGNIINSVAGGTGTINFAGNSTVTGDVGTTNPVAILNVQGNNTTTVDLQGDVTVNELNYTSTGITTVGGTLTATTGVNFGGFQSTLTFNGVGGPYTFASPVSAAGNATLNVDTDLTATDQTIGTIKTINIGVLGTPQTFTIAVNQPALGLLAAGGSINFSDPDSALILKSGQIQTVTFSGDLSGPLGGGGNVTLDGTNALTIAGGSFGANNALGSVSTIGAVTANGGINLSGITTLDVTGGSSFTDQTVTSASSTNINIGDNTGLATYILTPSANFNISTSKMKFNNANSTLNITSTGNVTATMDGDLDPGAVGNGIILLSSTGGLLTITGANNLGINGGNTLNSITFSGLGDITVTPAINIANALSTGIAGNLTLGTVNGPINFTNTTNLTVDDVTGQIDFVGLAGTTNVTNGGQVAAVTSSAVGAAAGTLAFAGNGTASGAITNIAEVSIDGDNTTIVEFQDDVTATNFNYTSTGTADMGGNLTSTGGVNFGNFASTLTFNGVPGPYVFASPVSAAGNATLNVDTTLTATDATIGSIKTINIGQANAAQTFTIAVNQAVLSLLATGGVVNFNDANSALIIQPGQAQALTFGGNLEGAAGGGGLLTFDASNGALTLAGSTGAETIGAGNKLTAINMKGNVTLLGAANKLDISGTGALNLKAGSVFTDQSLTSPDIAAINIGEVAGAATYILDAVNGDFDLTPGVTFGNAASILQLQTTIAGGGNSLITLQGDIDPGSANTGIIQINAANAGATLTIDGAFNVGIANGNTVQQVNFTGNGAIVMQQPIINAASPINTSVTTLTLGDVNSGINFTGPTNLTVGDVNGDINFGNQAGIANLSDGSTITGTVDGSTTATLNFLGAGTVTGLIGNVSPLLAVNFNGPGAVDLQQTAKATTFTINNAGAIVTAANVVGGNVVANNGQFTGTTILGNVSIGTAQVNSDVSGNVNFTGNGTLTATIISPPGQIDFAGNAGTVNVNNNGSIAGNVISSAAAAGDLVFAGTAVIGAINNIGAININGAAGNIVTFQQDVSATSLTFGNGGTANLQGSLTTSGGVDFGAGGILQFSGANPAGYTFNSVVTNGATAVLNAFANLTATDPSIGTVQTINIGQANAPKTFTVDVSKGLLTLLQPPGSTINFGDTNSVFGLTTSKNQQVTFANSFGGFAGGGGSVNLSSTGGAVLEIQGLTGAETLGKVGAALASINITGNVGVVGGANSLDVSNTAVLNIANGGVFADQSITSAKINKINIGDNTGPGTYALDALNGDFQLNAPGVTFVNPASVLKLMTTIAGGNTSTITLTGDIDPGGPNTGIVELNVKNAASKLIIDGTANAYSIGTQANLVNVIKFTGDGAIGVTAIYTNNISMSVPELGIETVNANAFFAPPTGVGGPTQFGTTTVNGNMDFQNVAGTAVFKTTNNTAPVITGNITSTGGPNGTVVFIDNGTIGTVDGNGNSTNTITNLAMLKAGADNSTVTINAGGNMSIAEIQGTGTGTIEFTQETNFTGNINETGGSAVNLTFNNNGNANGVSSIRGNMGNSAAVGDVTILTGTLSLGVENSVPDSIIKGGKVFLGPTAILDYDTSKGAFTGIFNYVAPVAFGIFAAVPITGGVRFDDSDPVTDNAQYGASGNSLGIIQINGGDVTLTNQVYVNNVKFTTANAATLTLANTSVVGGATTTGDKIHTLAITGDLTTGTSPFGSDSNHLKTVQLNSDGKITIDSQDFYSSITTKTNNQGTAIFNADNGFTDDLGGENLSLKLVQFSSNKGTVKGDTYAQNITIDAGKSAVFTGYNSRSLDIPSATVGGVKVPRATTKFNYQTLIVSDSFKGSDGTSSAEYTNAALVQAPINGGSHKFDDDVWLQKPLTGTNTITFAPKKTAFIQSDLGASTIVADQATMMFVGDNTSVNVGGNISGSNITFDLGNNKVTYTGSATPTGELIINVFYDTTNADQTGNANSGNIVLASGGTVDLSNVSSIKVFLTAQNNPSAIGQGSAYPIISGAEGSIIVGNAASLPFNVTANEGGFVRWQITNGSFVLLPIEVTGDNVIDNIIGKIIKAPPGSDAAKVANVIVNTPIGQRHEVVEHLLPIIERPSIGIHRRTNPLTPKGPIVGPNIGGFSPSQPPPTTGNVVNNIYVPPSVPGGYDVTPSNPAGYVPSTPTTGGGFGPNGPGTGGTTSGNIPGGSITGGVFNPNGPAVVAPSGPGTGGSGPNGPGATGGNIGTGGTTTGGNIPGGGGFGPNGPGNVGTTGTTGNSPANVGSNPYGPGVTTPTSSVGGSPSTGGGGFGPNGPGNVGTTGATGNGPANVGSNPYGPGVTTPTSSVGGSPSTGGGGFGPNGPGNVGTTGATGNGPANVGSNPYGPGVTTPTSSVGGSPTVGTTGGVGTGGSNPNSPVIGGHRSGGTPTVGTTGTTGNGPANVGSNPYGPGVTTPTSSIGGSTSNIGSSGTTTGGTGSNVGTTGSSPAGGNNVYSPSTGGTRNNVGGYSPSVGQGGSSYNGPASGGAVGTGGSSYNGSASGSDVYSSSTGGTRNNVGGYPSSAVQGGVSSSAPTSSGQGGAGGSSYNNSAVTDIAPANSGNSSVQGSSPALGGTTNGGVTNSGNNPYGNSGNPAVTGVSPANNSNGMGGSSDSGSGMPAIGSSRDNSSGTGSGVSSGSGISRSKANDGFNAAQDNASIGNQKVSERLKALEDENNATNPAAEDATSRKRGAAVGGGDCELDESKANNSVYGVWASPYYGKAVQKAFNGLSGYKAKSTGGSIGVDTVINDNIVLGAAYTRVDTKLRYQNAKAGNTTKVGTNMGSIYGLYNFINNLFIEGVTTYSRSDIKTNELRNIIGGLETAHGKYHSTSYSAQVVGGYNYIWKEASFAPMAGLRFAQIKDSGYHEYGTSFQNLTIKKRQYNKVEGILGGEIKTPFYKNGFLIIPQVHAFINYDFKGKTPAIIAELNGLNEPLPVPTPKPTKMLYDLGAGVVVKKGRMEYGLHYGLNLAKKYHAQSGTLRLKVNF